MLKQLLEGEAISHPWSRLGLLLQRVKAAMMANQPLPQMGDFKGAPAPLSVPGILLLIFSFASAHSDHHQVYVYLKCKIVITPVAETIVEIYEIAHFS